MAFASHSSKKVKMLVVVEKCSLLQVTYQAGLFHYVVWVKTGPVFTQVGCLGVHIHVFGRFRPERHLVNCIVPLVGFTCFSRWGSLVKAISVLVFAPSPEPTPYVRCEVDLYRVRLPLHYFLGGLTRFPLLKYSVL